MHHSSLIGTSCLMMTGMTIASVVSREEADRTNEMPHSIVGRVLLKGEPPRLRPVHPTSDPFCMQVHEKEPIKDESVVVGDDRELANVFVHVVSGLPDRAWPIPEEPVVLDQEGCRFIPHVFGVMAGQTLEIRNSDNTSHHIHGLTRKNEPFNFNQPRPGMKRHILLHEPETFMIKSDIHPWESAYCHVMEHPFFAVTDENGRFAIRGLPAGEYEIEFWHEMGPTTRTVKVKVDEDKVADLKDMEFEIEMARRRGHPDRTARPRR